MQAAGKQGIFLTNTKDSNVACKWYQNSDSKTSGTGSFSCWTSLNETIKELD